MDFNTLMQQAQKLTSENELIEDIPRLERNLSQVLQATHELHSRLTQEGTQDIQANLLLGPKGIDLKKIGQKLDNLSSSKTFEALEPASDTDINSFLKNERENAILSIVDEVIRQVHTDIHERWLEYTFREWEKEKKKLLNSFVGPSQNFINISKLPQQTVLDDVTHGRTSCLTGIEMAYSREICDYNKCIIDGDARPDLVKKFVKLAETFNDPKVSEMWEIIKYMVDVAPVNRSIDPIQTRSKMTQLITQAKKYLEDRYKLFINTIISSNLSSVHRGGVPSMFNTIAAYVDITSNTRTHYGLQDQLIEGKPLWPMVYYSLRCGDINAALHCIKMAGSGYEDITQALEEKLSNSDGKISSKLEGQLKMQYKCQIKNSTDPFKKAVFCIIAGCDFTNQHAELIKTTDDFLWLQLSLVLSDTQSGAGNFTYANLQSLIIEKYGEKHFNAGDQRHLYFQVLALTGQFESAIEFLVRSEKYMVHAVHMAVALNEMCLLSLPRNVQEPLLSIDIADPVPMRRLNIARLVMLYVRKFETADPAEALQYLFFLRNLKSPEGKNLFLVSVTDLAIECRDYELLFGKIQPNGVRSRGLLDRFENVHFDIAMIAETVAEELVKKGIFEDALLLFDVAGNYTQELKHLCILLSQVVHQKSRIGSLRERLSVHAERLNERLKDSRDVDSLQSAKLIHTFRLLYQLLKFFDCYHDKKYKLALDILMETMLVPLNVEDVENCINNFKKLGNDVCKIYPDLLLATMHILYTEYTTIKSKALSGSFDHGKEQMLAVLREKAKALTNMAATVPYKMPSDINVKLVQTEIKMHQ